MSEPLILTKNYVNEDDTISVTHGSATKDYLFDRDIDSKWITTGANSDATTVTIEISFYERSVAVSRTINRLLLINYNWKAWRFYYWDGSAWQQITAQTVDASSTRFVSFSSQSTTKVKFEIDSTQTVNAEKFAGEIVVAALQLDLGQEMDDYDPSYSEKSSVIELGDGGSHKMISRWTPNRSQRYRAKVIFKNISEANRLLLKAIAEAREPFLWYPESTYRPSDIFLVNWNNSWTGDKYVIPAKPAGVEVLMDLQEV